MAPSGRSANCARCLVRLQGADSAGSSPRPELTPEERAERLEREREFRELLEKPKALDKKLAAEREQRKTP
jgi:hypothetical protein